MGIYGGTIYEFYSTLNCHHFERRIMLINGFAKLLICCFREQMIRFLDFLGLCFACSFFGLYKVPEQIKVNLITWKNRLFAQSCMIHKP